MGLELPPLPKPVANYVPGLEVGGFLYISGQGPRNSDGKFIQGIVGENLTVAEAYQHAWQTGLFLLSVAKYQLGSLDQIKQIVKLTAFVRCGSDFTDQPQVANGVSDLLREVFGEQGKHARSAVGVAALPGGMCFEAELILKINWKWNIQKAKKWKLWLKNLVVKKGLRIIRRKTEKLGRKNINLSR